MMIYDVQVRHVCHGFAMAFFFFSPYPWKNYRDFKRVQRHVGENHEMKQL